MDDKYRDILRRHWSLLRRDMEPIKLLPHLVKILDVTDEQEIKGKATRLESSDMLLEILPRRGPEAFHEFVKALQEVQPFLASPLIQGTEMEEVKTELSQARTDSAGLKEEVRTIKTELEIAQQSHKTTLKELQELKSLQEKLIGNNDSENMETRA